MLGNYHVDQWGEVPTDDDFEASDSSEPERGLPPDELKLGDAAPQFDDFFAELSSMLAAPGNEKMLDSMVEAFTDETPEFAISDQDVLDVLGDPLAKKDGIKKPVAFRPYPASRVPRAEAGMSNSSLIPISEPLSNLAGPLFLVGSRHGVFVKSISGSHKVGATTSGKKFRVRINMEKVKTAVDILQEDCAAKGTGLGFSHYIHCYAMVIICLTDAVPQYEPRENFDVRTSYATFEVTGKNAHRRRTTADCCISKYALIKSVMALTPDLEKQFVISKKEDASDPSCFWGTSFDQPPSPYTDVVRQMAKLTPLLEDRQKNAMMNQFRHWLSKQEPIENVRPEGSAAPGAIRAALVRGSKDGMLPAPLKVMSPTGAQPPERFSKMHICPHTAAISAGSTYHTIPIDDLSFAGIDIQGTEMGIETMYSVNSHHDILYRRLSRYPAFQAAHIMSELLGKIIGSAGFFYSVYSRVGITWKRVRANSLTYYIAFYTHAHPGDERLVGRWSHKPVGVLNEYEYWLSPTTKTSIKDIQFAQLVNVRFFTLVTSMLAYCTPSEIAKNITPLFKLLPVIMSSSWQTSALAGDMRFYTLCSISDSGDTDTLASKAAESVKNKPLSTADTYFLLLLRSSVESRGIGMLDRTPLLKLPIRFLAIEKDLPQMMMWHIRGDSHATDCMTKMLKSKMEEEQNRASHVEHLGLQLKYMSDALSEGVGQERFDELMDRAPSFTYYNHILTIVLQRRAIRDKNSSLGARQVSSGYSLTTMLTDHHAVHVDTPSGVTPNTYMKNIRVLDGQLALMKRYDNPTNAYDLLVRMSEGPFLANIYGMHEKDSKSGNREISQMTPEDRPLQGYAEFMSRAFCNTDDADMMLEKEKFKIVVEELTSQLKKLATIRSEDKSFFAGRLMPECLGLSIFNIGVESGNTSLVSAGSAIMTDTERTIVLPGKFDLRSATPGMITGTMARRVGKQTLDVGYTKVHMHMQQGMRAMGGAAHSTCFSVGLGLFQEDVMPEISDRAVYTTSDDAVRSYVPAPETKAVYCRKSLNDEYFGRHVQLMEHAMMKDNVTKPIESQALAEFNNVVVNRNGMIPQQFIHTALILQPLRGQSLISDLIQAVSSGRQSVFWGDSIDVASSAYESYLLLLRQKWLLSSDDIDLLHMAGLLPESDEELLAGFSVRREETKWRLWAMIDEESQARVRRGEVTLVKALSRFTLARKKKKVVKRAEAYTLQNTLFNKTVETIRSSRDYTQRLAGAYIRPAHISDRIRARDQLLRILRVDVPQPNQGDIEILRSLSLKTTVTISPIPIRRYHSMPQRQGSASRTTVPPNRSVVLALRGANICLGRLPEQDEVDASELEPEAFGAWLTKMERTENYEGFAFTSVTGFPRMRFLNGEMYTNPMSFTFFSDVVEHAPTMRDFTVEGDQYSDMELVDWGGTTLTRCREVGAIPVFGKSVGHINTTFFFYGPSGRAESVQLPSGGAGFQIIKRSNYSIGVLSVKDMSPISPLIMGVVDVGKAYCVPGLIGDSTAIWNYGDYLNCDSREAFKIMGAIFNQLGSKRPEHLRRFAKPYPSFQPSAVVVPHCRLLEFIGSQSAKKVRIALDGDMIEYARADCTNREPVIRTHYVREEAYDFDFE